MSDEDSGDDIELVSQHEEIRNEIRDDEDYFIYRGQQNIRDRHDYKGDTPGLQEALGRFFHKHALSLFVTSAITVGMAYLSIAVLTGGAVLAGSIIAGAAGLATLLLAKDMYEDGALKRQDKQDTKEIDRKEYLKNKGLTKETPEPTLLDSKQDVQSNITKDSYSTSKKPQLSGLEM
jgi:hypothetical protein